MLAEIFALGLRAMDVMAFVTILGILVVLLWKSI